MPVMPNMSYSTAVAKDEANIFTKLFDNSNEDITLSKLSNIFKTNFAFLSPFLYLNSILGFEVAVNAVSDPDKKPDKIINMNKHKINKKVINVI